MVWLVCRRLAARHAKQQARARALIRMQRHDVLNGTQELGVGQGAAFVDKNGMVCTQTATSCRQLPLHSYSNAYILTQMYAEVAIKCS